MEMPVVMETAGYELQKCAWLIVAQQQREAAGLCKTILDPILLQKVLTQTSRGKDPEVCL